MVDAKNLVDEYYRADALIDRGESLGDDGERTVTDLLIDQFELADVIVLSKVDLTTEAKAAEVESVLRALNPGAKIHRAIRGNLPLDAILGTGLFDCEKAASSAGWIRELSGEHKPETEEYGISSFVYRTAHPPNADRLWEFFHTPEEDAA